MVLHALCTFCTAFACQFTGQCKRPTELVRSRTSLRLTLCLHLSLFARFSEGKPVFRTFLSKYVDLVICDPSSDCALMHINIPPRFRCAVADLSDTTGRLVLGFGWCR